MRYTLEALVNGEWQTHNNLSLNDCYRIIANIQPQSYAIWEVSSGKLYDRS